MRRGRQDRRRGSTGESRKAERGGERRGERIRDVTRSRGGLVEPPWSLRAVEVGRGRGRDAGRVWSSAIFGRQVEASLSETDTPCRIQGECRLGEQLRWLRCSRHPASHDRQHGVLRGPWCNGCRRECVRLSVEHHRAPPYPPTQNRPRVHGRLGPHDDAASIAASPRHSCTVGHCIALHTYAIHWSPCSTSALDIVIAPAHFPGAHACLQTTPLNAGPCTLYF